MDVKKIKRELERLTPMAIQALEEIIRGKTVAPTARLKAIEMLYDRIGLPALKASISQTVSAPVLPVGDMKKLQAQLVLTQEEADKEIEVIRGSLAPLGEEVGRSNNGGSGKETEAGNSLHFKRQ